MTKLQKLTAKLDELNQPYQKMSETQLIIDPQSSPMMEIIPFSHEIWLRDQPFIYLDVDYPYNPDWFNEFMGYTVEQIKEIASKI